MIDIILNRNMLTEQGIDEEGEKAILALHEERMLIFEMMSAIDPDTEMGRLRLREWASVVEDLEYRLQDAWGFPRNRDYHSWWYRVPHCNCPQLDNYDYYGTPFRIFVETCPVHNDPDRVADLVADKEYLDSFPPLSFEMGKKSLWKRFLAVMHSLRFRPPTS